MALAVLMSLMTAKAGLSDKLPPLPAADGSVVIPTQENGQGGARLISIYLRYPGGRLDNVRSSTGLMLVLHNWGGKEFGGAPIFNPGDLDVVIIGVDYYQSGDADHSIPYDYGYYQAIDALRALAYVRNQLSSDGIAFNTMRIFGAGGSGGGTVIQMANKFAPHTFACIVDCSGMASLTDDIAFKQPGGSDLDARYSTDISSPACLSNAMRQIRDLGNRDHLALAAKWGCECKVVVIHGEDDTSCLVQDKKRVVQAMKDAGLNVEAHFITKADVDGQLITDSGHTIGSRGALLLHFAGEYLAEQGPKALSLHGPDDFKRGETFSFPVEDGQYRVSFQDATPTVIWVPNS